MSELSSTLLRIAQAPGDTQVPAARFGHTFTLVSKSKAVLFGGAIGDSGKFVITNESFLFDFLSNKWRKLECTGEIPTQRAAHASCQVNHMMMIIYGGAASGGGGLSSDDLVLLDLKALDQTVPNGNSLKTKQQIQASAVALYTRISVTGQTPGKRYGHSMVFQSPNLILFGGNTGTQAVNDVWVLHVEKTPLTWQRICLNGQESPSPRVYHAAALCTSGLANGMMVVFGGRKQDQNALNDTWGLRKHKDGTWDWVLAPYKQSSAFLPVCRYQHRVEFVGSLMVVVGGRTNSSDDQGRCVDVYDTESSDWYRLSSFNRYRHTTVVIDQTMYVHGGFEPEFPNKPLDSMLTVDLTSFSVFYPKLSKHLGIKEDQNILGEKNQIDTQHTNGSSRNIQTAPSINQKKPMSGSNMQQLVGRANSNQHKPNSAGNISVFMNTTNPILDVSMSTMDTTLIHRLPPGKLNNTQRSFTPIKTFKQSKDIKISNQVVVATSQNSENMYQGYQKQQYPKLYGYQQQQQQQQGVFKRVNIVDLAEESKKLTAPNENDTSVMMVQQTNLNLIGLADMFINTLMKRPDEWKYTEPRLPFKKEFILRLCDEMCGLLLEQPSLLRLRAPLKIFGNLHGRFSDLLRFFSNFGYPIDEEGGDIEKFDYLFLGNYVDRGYNSLETIMLLFALKLKFPDQVHLIRGAHEERKLNKIFGFAEECAIRLSEDINNINSVYQRVNRVFDCLPLAALIEEKIFVVHGGIGPNVTHVNDILDLKRPISPFSNSLVYDLLYSDYSENDVSAITENKQKDYFDTNQNYKFSDIKVEQFLQETGLNMIIRSKEEVSEGFQRSRSGLVTTITSCTDYMGKLGNSACMIKIKKNFQVEPNILPKALYRYGIWTGPESAIKSNIYFTEEETKLRRRPHSPLKSI